MGRRRGVIPNDGRSVAREPDEDGLLVGGACPSNAVGITKEGMKRKGGGYSIWRAGGEEAFIKP